MGLFGKKNSEEETALPAVFENPRLTAREGFKGDSELSEPLIRLSKRLRERFGVRSGDYVSVKRGDRVARARVEVSSASDGGQSIVRMNARVRELLNAQLGDDIEVIPHETLILLIDTSGSMSDFISGKVKIDAAKNAVVEFIRSKFLMAQGDRVGIASFGQVAAFVEKPSSDYERLEGRVDALVPNGSTAMYEGLRISLDELASVGGAKRIVLLTDGMPTTTGRMSIISMAKEAASRNIVIDTVGVGSPFDFISYDEMLLKRIAAITGGTFRRVMDVEQLTGQFRELAEGKNYTYLLPEK